jgi:glycosyltransferase involved in cell wall biosynthesis
MTDILHIIDTFISGGATRALLTCASGCTKSNGTRHRIASLAPVPGKESRELAWQYGLELLEAPEQAELFKAIEVSDIIHLHYWNAPHINEFLHYDLPPMRLLIKLWVGGLHPPQVITRALANFGDIIQTSGPFAKNLPLFSQPDFSEHRDRIRMCYGPTDISRLKNFQCRPHLHFNITYLGTVDFLKMHPDYVAMSSAVHVPKARFIVCGRGTGFELLEKQARQMGTCQRFDFRKSTEDILSLLAITDVFGYPLCEDNYSACELVLQETAFCGIPAVVFSNGGAEQMVINDFTGYVVNSAAEYRDALEYLYHRPDERARLGVNARNYAKEHFNPDNATRITSDMYAQLLQEPKRKRFFHPNGNRINPAKAVKRGKNMQAQSSNGAWKFVSSLGETAPWFKESLTAESEKEQLASDQKIAESSPVMADGALFRYRDYHSHDGWLRFWSGTVMQTRQDDIGAALEFTRAVQLGCDHWRVFWRMAQSMLNVQETYLAIAALQRVIKSAPEFSDAEKLLETLQGREKRLPSIKALQMRREIFTLQGKLEQAEAAGHQLLADKHINTTFQDLEAYYKIGLAAHKANKTELTSRIYQLVLQKTESGNELASWAAFKQGEMFLDTYDEDSALAMFKKAVTLNPNHAKAKIYLVMPQEKLTVCMGLTGNKSQKGIISVPMDPLDAKLWPYYFSRRSPDGIHIYLDRESTSLQMEKLNNLLISHLAPNGVGEIYRIQNDGRLTLALRTTSTIRNNHIKPSNENCASFINNLK